VEQVRAAFAESAAAGQSIGLRGAGCSYGDAALNTGGAVLDLSVMNRILAFDTTSGVMRVEPGVTFRQIWRESIAHGWWPAVVPGTMEVTAAGAAAMNIHGKNNFAAGTFGEHVEELTLLTPRGELVACSRDREPELFHAVIGGFGMLGCIVELTLHLKRVHSGRLRVTAFATKDLEGNLEVIERERGGADYLVGWLDAHARGAALGRGLVHRADQLAPGEDPEGARMLRAEAQDVPPRLFGVVPKGWIWPGLWCLVKLGGLRPLNAAKFRAGLREQCRPPYLQTHGAFHFLLDYVPRWKWAFRPGGLIQFQPFVPANEAARVLRTLLESCQRERLVPYLLVLKRHRPDPFLMTHALDGYSLAMDFAVTGGNRERLWRHCQGMAEVVLEAGGRFYYAKDAVLLASSFPRIHGEDAVRRFRALKQRVDPGNLLSTDLARRLRVV
jgi:FAD/FMN-containing dehydrogenase